MVLKNMSSQSYSNMSLIHKGINYPAQNSLFLLFVNHLVILFRKQRAGLFRKGRKYSPSRKRQRQFPSPPTGFNPQHSQQNQPVQQQQQQHNQPKKHGGTRPPSSYHFNWKFEDLLKYCKIIANIFFTMWINFPSFRIPTKAKAEMLFRPPGLYAGSQKGYGLSSEEICG